MDQVMMWIGYGATGLYLVGAVVLLGWLLMSCRENHRDGYYEAHPEDKIWQTILSSIACAIIWPYIAAFLLIDQIARES